jgi:hypothetical protein
VTTTRHPLGVIVDGVLYERDEFYRADHISPREWLALGLVLIGIGVWAFLMLSVVLWLVHRWL